MKKTIAIVLAFLLIPVAAFAEVTTEQLDELSYADKAILKFNVGIAIANKENGGGKERYSHHLKIDLMDLSAEELHWMFDYLSGDVTDPYDGYIQTLPERYGIEIVPSKEVFAKDGRVAFCLYCTISEACRVLGMAVQNHNPEIYFDASTQTLDMARFYVTYYAKGSKADLRIAIEEYTDVLIETICATYPEININTLVFCWKVPDVDPDSLYAAVYWCEKNGDKIECGDGSGILYK